jgi:DNA end-binding protein Ku
MASHFTVETARPGGARIVRDADWQRCAPVEFIMARPIWKGSINFGLVNIPIQLETAVREKNVSFHLLSKDGTCRLRRKLYCPETGDEFDYNDTARGIEIAKDQYVLVDEKEIDNVRPEKSRAIEIEQFVDMDALDPIYFDRVYFVTPGEGSSKAYKLFHEALAKSKKIGVARFVMRERQNLAILRVLGEGIVLHSLHYDDEVLKLEDTLPTSLAKVKPAAKELDVAMQLIDAMSKPLHIEEYKDEYREQLEKLIESKKKGKKMVVIHDEHFDEPMPRTINLMEALKKSLNANKGTRTTSRTHHPRRKSA